MRLVRVALDVPLDRLFDYALPDHVEAHAGDRVVVPFGSRRRVGIVLEAVDHSDLPAERIKHVVAVSQDAPRLSEGWLALIRFLSEYYQRPLGETAVSSLPPRLKALRPLPAHRPTHFALVDPGPESPVVRAARKRAVLDELRCGILDEASLGERLGEPVTTLRPVLRDLLATGHIRGVPAPCGTRYVARHPLTDAQRAVTDQLAALPDGFRASILHGVTGSGKTEVYLELVAQVLARGRQALILVPEIGLTPQLAGRFVAAFPDARIALMHSGLDERTRTEGWLSAARGEVQIALGTRLAALVPLDRLGLVVVDEEHDASFKQQEGLRYSGRDVAIYRAKLADCPVILGSATPSIETWQHGESGRFSLHSLPERAAPGSELPEVRVIDLRTNPSTQGLSTALLEAIEKRMAARQQSLVFINRRGYAPVLACEACGWAAGCERCSARMVLHAATRALRCHHCGAESAIPHACPTCGNVDLRALGRGTQRVEETLAKRFPGARIARIDRDAMRSSAALSRTLDDARDGRVDLLVGTQLLAKGHDFPGLTLVGVIDADQALLSTDYRAPERLFATLVQVGGRAGRREQRGEVLIQTRFPQHPMFDALMRHDYAGFARQQLDERRAAGFPPFVFEAALRADAPTLDAAMRFLAEAAALVSPPDAVSLYDPAPLTLTRRAGLERAQLIAQSRSRRALQSFLADWRPLIQHCAPRTVHWHLDVDPTSFD